MDPCANLGCVLRVNASCEACRRKLLEVLSFICDTRILSIDAHTGLAHIRQRVDINFVLHTLAKSGQYAELVHVRVPHDPNRRHRPQVALANPFLPLRNALPRWHHNGGIGYSRHHHGLVQHQHGIKRCVHHHHHHGRH